MVEIETESDLSDKVKMALWVIDKGYDYETWTYCDNATLYSEGEQEEIYELSVECLEIGITAFKAKYSEKKFKTKTINGKEFVIIKTI